MMAKKAVDIKLQEGRLEVRLQRSINPEIEIRLGRLCEELDEMSPVTIGGFRLPVVYEVV